VRLTPEQRLEGVFEAERLVEWMRRSGVGIGQSVPERRNLLALSLLDALEERDALAAEVARLRANP
jgi:hypothetical protein